MGNIYIYIHIIINLLRNVHICISTLYTYIYIFIRHSIQIHIIYINGSDCKKMCRTPTMRRGLEGPTEVSS